MQLGLQEGGGNGVGGGGEHCESLLSGPGENPLETFLVFWCPNMFKQPVYGTFLGSISTQIICFLSFKIEFLKFNSKLSF